MSSSLSSEVEKQEKEEVSGDSESVPVVGEVK